MLYTLNDLCNSSKHALITFIVGAVSEFKVTLGSDAARLDVLPEIVWDSSKNEIEFARIPIGTNFEHDGRLQVYIAIGETVPAAGNIHASRLFLDTRDEVRRVVYAIEAESRRIDS